MRPSQSGRPIQWQLCGLCCRSAPPAGKAGKRASDLPTEGARFGNTPLKSGRCLRGDVAHGPTTLQVARAFALRRGYPCWAHTGLAAVQRARTSVQLGGAASVLGLSPRVRSVGARLGACLRSKPITTGQAAFGFNRRTCLPGSACPVFEDRNLTRRGARAIASPGRQMAG